MEADERRETVNAWNQHSRREFARSNSAPSFFLWREDDASTNQSM